MRWRRAAGAGLILVAELLQRTGIVLAEEHHSSQRVLADKPFQRPPGRKSMGATRHRQGVAATGPVDFEPSCPYAIETEEEADRRVKDTSLPGNVVTVEHLEFCRTGNHFINVIRNLAAGYCCKSRVLWLPPKDDVLAPGIFNEGTPGPRWFDFSSAPDVPDFNSSSCSTDITWAGLRAFHMYQLELQDHEFYNPELLKCVSRAPRLLGCEAAYFFPKDVDICPADAAPSASTWKHEERPPEKAGTTGEQGWRRGLEPEAREDTRDEEGGRGENGEETQGTENVQRRVQSNASGKWKNGDDWDDDLPHEKSGDRDGDEGGRLEEGSWEESSQGGGEGTLVLHVRSGDIFDNEILAYYGQPPLQVYVRAIEDANWDRVEVLTNGQDEKTTNPVIPALQEKVAAGELPSNVHFYTNRSMEEDLRSMICADGLVLARSTLVSLTGFHSNAQRIYGPIQCNAQLNNIALLRPDRETYGLIWPGRYSVYVRWENTPYQREEMLTYDKVSGFTECTGEGAQR